MPMPKDTMVTCLPGARHLRLADRHQPVVDLWHVEALAVEDLVFEEHDRIVVADGGLQQPLGVGG
jgi:hypothetical protein